MGAVTGSFFILFFDGTGNKKQLTAYNSSTKNKGGIILDINQLTQIVNNTLTQYGVKIDQKEYGIGNKEFSMLLVTELFKAEIKKPKRRETA